jgi:hypothetical protein
VLERILLALAALNLLVLGGTLLLNLLFLARASPGP